MKKFLVWSILMSFITINGFVDAQITGEWVMKQVNARYCGDDSSGEITLVLRSDSGNEKTRSILYWVKRYKNEAEKMLIKVTDPPDLEGTKFLTYTINEKERKQWIYLPALRKAKLLSGGQRRGSFLGSDFSYSDIGKEALSEFYYNLQGYGEVDGRRCYIIEKIPQDKENTFSKMMVWIDEERFIPLRVDYLRASAHGNEDEGLEKQMRVLEGKMIDGIYTVIRTEMTNFIKDHKTIMLLNRVEYNNNLPDRLFNVQNLRR